jgi:hypothetical protein
MAYTTIDDPSEYFTTLLYTGNATDNRNLTNDANAGDFKPDWLWLKERTGTSSHQLVDSTRGSSFAVMSDSNAVEDEDANRVQAFQTNGFQVGTASTVNQNTITNVAWQWKANGGTTTTNDASSTGVGNTDSVIQANTTAGFSIVTFTSPGSGLTIAHGLGGKPDLIISKSRESTEKWGVHTTLIDGSLDFLRLSETDAKGNSGFSLPTSTVFGYNGSDDIDYIAYCFRSIQGYSKIGTYVGNGNADGTFVYTGFKPAWIMIKRTSDGGNDWIIIDTTRFTFNLVDNYLRANTADAETDQYAVDEDILSNGFKLRGTSGNINASGSVYIYMAFAERPFVSSEGVPTTAR